MKLAINLALTMGRLDNISDKPAVGHYVINTYFSAIRSDMDTVRCSQHVGIVWRCDGDTGGSEGVSVGIRKADYGDKSRPLRCRQQGPQVKWIDRIWKLA